MQPSCKIKAFSLWKLPNVMSRKETLIASVLLILFGTGMHFVHHFPFFNHFWGYIFPVQESVMAHMKMVLYPMFLLSLYLVISRRDIHEFGAHDGSHIDDDVQGHEFVMHEHPVGEEHRHDQGHYRQPRQDGGAEFMDVPPADDQV